jgi:hypothetical protein
VAKLQKYGEDYYGFHCPGCECDHAIQVNGTKFASLAGWGWNQSIDSPTFNPSILVHSHPQFELPDTPRCHSFVRDGKIMFLTDCTHKLAGQTVEIPEWDDD